MKYKGSCHCGSIAFEVEGEITGATDCNCSICQKRGWILTFVPQARFHLLSGRDALTDYQFNKKNLHHPFCSTCGVASFSEGENPKGDPMVAINVRCLDGVDVIGMTPSLFDGRSL